jgi:hypothetical protein
MLDCFQPVENDDGSLLETPEALPQQLMQISMLADAQTLPGAKSMKIQVEVQGIPMIFLLDFGSSSCFIDSRVARDLTGSQPLPTPLRVQIAGGVCWTALSIFQNWIGHPLVMCFETHFEFYL